MLADIAASVRSRRVTPLELVDEALRRIDALNPALNAVVTRCDDAAREAARTHSGAGVLAGIPVLIKDLTRVAGMRTTSGSPWYAAAPFDTEDDILVTRLKAAGAIVVGKTNTPSFGHQGVTVNQVFGATRNPWNLACSPGGSSGGAAAALAAHLVPLATATDGGGSVRGPASYAGLVGYKPTNGLIGRSSTPRWITFSTSGSCAHTVADAMLEVAVVAGTARGDVYSVPPSSGSFSLRKPKRAIAVRTLRGGVDEPIGAAFDEVCKTISDELAIPVTVVDRISALDGLMVWLTIAVAELAEALEPHRAKWGDVEPTLGSLLGMGQKVTTAQYIAAQRDRFTFCRDVEALLDDGQTVLLTPTSNVTSFPAEGPMPALGINTMDFNVTGQPGVSVPMGLDPTGVPMGLQIVAPRFDDGLALGLAVELERSRPWPMAAPGYSAWPA